MSFSQTEAAEKTLKLYEVLSLEDIDKIQRQFRKQKSGGLSYEKFRSLLARFDVVYSDDVFHNVCLKIDMDRDNVVNWGEFIAYFICELQIDDNMNERFSIVPPIPKSTNVLSTQHRNRVIRILFTGDRSGDGNYATIGCYGDLHMWSPKWKLETILHAGKLMLTSFDEWGNWWSSELSDEIPETSSSTIELSDRQQIKKSSRTLILDAVSLMDLQIICISSVCSDLRFYDVSSASKCNLRLYIRNFPCPLNSFFYHCAASDGEENSKLILGDAQGSVRVIYLSKGFKRTFREGSLLRQFSYRELIKVNPLSKWKSEAI